MRSRNGLRLARSAPDSPCDLKVERASSIARRTTALVTGRLDVAEMAGGMHHVRREFSPGIRKRPHEPVGRGSHGAPAACRQIAGRDQQARWRRSGTEQDHQHRSARSTRCRTARAATVFVELLCDRIGAARGVVPRCFRAPFRRRKAVGLTRYTSKNFQSGILSARRASRRATLKRVRPRYDEILSHASAWSMSSMRSPTSSRPIDSRTVPGADARLA